MTQTAPDFVHLHVHTQYSLLDGAIHLQPLFQRTAEYGMHSVAITDHGTMFGAIEFYDMALKAGIKPIIGCEMYMAPRSLKDKTSLDKQGMTHLVLLAENQEGYKNLCKLATIAQLDGFYYKPRIDRTVLQEYSKGLIALSACLKGDIPQRIIENRMDLAEEAARFYLETFGEGRFYLEVQDNGMEIQYKVNEALLDMSQRLSIPLVASNDCHYLDRSDARAHEVLLCIQTGSTMSDANRFKFTTDQLYFKSPAEMQASFADFPGALSNTVEIAGRCQLEFDFNTYHFPQYDPQSTLSINEIFENEVCRGFEQRLADIRAKHPDIDEAPYRERLEYEIRVIEDMEFPGYFLIVADFIRYAKENHIPVGPGRGSAAGSLVAYSMQITDLDPLEHGLIFERFLNPARISMPDIDVDFCINGREKVFKYVSERYGGGDYVAQIITFGKLKTRAVIRDVGRALDIPLGQVDVLAKMVPEVLNISLEKALEEEPRILEMAEEKPEIRELLDICRVLEGLTRHASTHAAGVVVSDKPLVEYLPLYKGKNGEIITQFDMKRVEQIGLVKFDFLGLRNLTVIDTTLKLIEAQGKTPPDLVHIDSDDSSTYALLSRGDTTGVFQLESAGMKDLLVRLKPACFADITALVALYRPGPLDSGMVDDFVERKHGREPVVYLLPELEPILQETYGVILYQEQVMKIAAVLANYSMAEADGLRKAMGKKIAQMMAKHRELFMKGAEENRIDPEKAKQIFDLMEKFGGYGFNKSHSAAYALIAYQTAYLKTHFPVEFMAALLTSEMHSADGVVKFISECRSHSIEVLPPDINESGIEFTVHDEKIRFGLVAVKNVGEGAIEAILESRAAEGCFGSLFEFCERVNLQKVNKRVLESLIKCGAFDSTGGYRSQMMEVLEESLEYGQRVQREKNDPQMSLFDVERTSSRSSMNAPRLPEIDEWDDFYRLSLEKETLGFYITGHPLKRHETILKKFTTVNALSIREAANKDTVRLGGLIKAIKTIRTKRGDPMAFVMIEDMLGGVEVVVFSDLYAQIHDLLVEDQAVLIEGEVQVNEKSVKVLADTLIPIEKAEETWTAEICFTINTETVERDQLYRMHTLLRQYPGTCRVYMYIVIPDQSETIVQLPENFTVAPSEALNREIKGLLGYDAVTTRCRSVHKAAAANNYRRFRSNRT